MPVAWARDIPSENSAPGRTDGVIAARTAQENPFCANSLRIDL
jgi:hypothetical protein